MTHRHRFHHDVTRSQIERFSDRHPFFPFSKHEENTHRERSTIPGGCPPGFGGQKYLYPRWRMFIRYADHKKAKRNISLFSARLPFFARVPLIFQRENGRKQISRNTDGRGYPRSDKSQVAPSTRKTHSKARRTTITPSLVLDEFLFIRSILGSLLLPLFFFFFSPTTHPFLPFSRATVTSSNWHVSQFDAYTVSKKEKNIVREEERENGKGGKKKFCASSSSSSRW